jgi:acyl transferase domain-containing protein
LTSDSKGPPVRGEVAIIGLACTYPGARRMEQFWQNIVNKFDAITDVDPEHWDPDVFFDPDPNAEDRLYSKKGGWLPTTFAFNPIKFGIPPATVAGSEPDQFLLLRCAFEALLDAGYLKREFNRERVSVIVGRGNYPGPGQTWLVMRTVVESVISIMRRMRPDLSEEKLQRLRVLLKAKIPKLTPEGAGGIIPNVTTGRAANRFDFMGQNFSVDAACASALIAADIGVRNLLTGVDDMTLIGGLHICSQVPFLSIFKATRATSLTSVVRPFDENADGTLGGEGVGMLVLKRLADAERDGDRIYAVIKGIGTASDGRAKHVLAPRVEGEILAIRRALEMAQVPPETIGLVECHGTATVVGDSTEIQALETAYGPAGVHGQTCAIGSVKSMIGHTMPAAGAASLIKTALALYQRVLPPTLNVNQPHPRLLDSSCRFYVNTETKPWIQRTDGPPRRAGVNAFGFGGINAHVVMEEYTRADEKSLPSHLRDWSTEVVIVEGTTRAGLLESLDSLREYVVRVEGVELRDVAYSLNTALTQGSHRVAIVASSLEDLARKIDRVKLRLSDASCTQLRERSGIFYFENPELRNGKLALLFPGEGAQYLNMMTDLCMHFPEVRKCFDLGDAAVKDPFRTPLSAVLYPPPAFSEKDEKAAEDRLWSLEHGTETGLTGDLAMFALTQTLKLRPDMMTGHSMGDWIALTASGILDLDEMIPSMDRLDRIYQKLKEETNIPKRAMLAVGAGREKILELSRQFNCPVEIANDNCPHQVVVVTESEGSQAFVDQLLKNGVFVERLPYDGGYHTESFTYMNDPLLQLFRDYTLRPAKVLVYCGMTAAPWPEDPEAIRQMASATYAHPILFTQTIERMYADGARIFVEAGPRGNLTAFVDDILRDKPHLSVPLDLFRRPGLTALNNAVGMLAAAHVPLDLNPLYQRRAPRKLSMKFERDSVVSEDHEPGVIQVSKVYRYLHDPEGDEFPMPSGASQPAPEVTMQELQPVSTSQSWTSQGAPQTSTPQASTPQRGTQAAVTPIPVPSEPATREQIEILGLAEAVPAAAISIPATPALTGGYASASVLEDHFQVMEEFLRTEEEIMGFMLGGSAAPPASNEFTLPPAVPDYQVAPPALQEPELQSLLLAPNEPETHSSAARPAANSIKSLIRNAEVKEETPGKAIVLRLALDLKEHHYLRDHSLTFPATEYNNQGNRIYKMPLTASVELASETAALLVPDQVVVSVSGIDIFRALQVVENEAPPVIEVAATKQASGEVRVQIRHKDGKAYSQATVRLASEYPTSPHPLDPALENPRAPQAPGKGLYTQRHMFHGPSFHGVRSVDVMADNGMLATLEILPTAGLLQSDPAPKFHIDPFLFDAAGQLVGYWPIENCNRGGNVLPIKVQQVNKYFGDPPQGTLLPCRMLVRSLSDQTLRCDYDVLLPDGRVWLRVIGWEDWRLYWPARLFDYAYGRFAKYQFAGIQIASEELRAADFECMLLPPLGDFERDPLLDESWSSVLFSRRELADFHNLSPQRQHESLFTSTSTKDSIRAWVMRKYNKMLFPADIELVSDGGTLSASGVWSKNIAPPQVSCFYSSGWSVAVAGSRLSAVAAMESDAAIPAGFFPPDEADRLARLENKEEWMRRAVIAKQAAGKYFRPNAEEDFWQTLVIATLDPGKGIFGVADPSSAVNAEDALRVITTHAGDYLMAVAFQS